MGKGVIGSSVCSTKRSLRDNAYSSWITGWLLGLRRLWEGNSPGQSNSCVVGR